VGKRIYCMVALISVVMMSNSDVIDRMIGYGGVC
jgi:hypothetical protein